MKLHGFSAIVNKIHLLAKKVNWMNIQNKRLQRNRPALLAIYPK